MWSRFALVFALAGALLLGLGVGTNFAIDVSSLYRNAGADPRIRAYVARLRESPHGLVQIPVERPVKLELARAAAADCAVIGSSHAMQVSLETLPRLSDACGTLVNAAVSGGTYEDLVTLLGALVDRPGLRRLVIGLDPWMLRRRADLRWSEYADAYAAGRARLGLAPEAQDAAVEKLRTLASARYLVRNLESLHERSRQGREVLAAVPVAAGEANVADEDPITRPDGSHRYSRRFLRDKPPPWHAVPDGGYKIARPFVDPTLVAEIETLLRHVKEAGLAAAFLLTPYHPKVWECRAAEVCEALRAVETEVRALAARHGLAVLGSYRPEPFGLRPQDFYDDMHVAREALARIGPIERKDQP